MNMKSPTQQFVRRIPGVFASGLLCASCLLPDLLASGNGTWLNTGSNANWNTAGNWVGGTVSGSVTANNSDVATFNTSVGTVGTAGNPVLVDTANWALKSITFDTADVGSFFIGTTGGNAIRLTTSGAITMTSGVTASQTVNAPLIIQATTGKYSFVNNAAKSSAVLNIGGAITAAATSGVTTLTLDGSNVGANTVTGVISNGTGTNSMALTKNGAGTWVLSAANTYSGATTLQGGNLVLDFTAAGAPSANILGSSSALALGTLATATAGNQTLTINGKAGANNTQTLGNLTFNASSALGGGASHINLNAGSGGTLALTLGTLGAKVGGATLDFALSDNASVKVGTASAATGSGSGLFANAITINGSDFATNNANTANALVGLSTISGAYDTSTSFSGNLTKALDVQGNTSITGTGTANLPAIRFNQTGASTLTIASGKIASVSTGNGAILVTANVGANTTTITGGTLTGVGSRDLSLIQNNTLGRLQIDSAISGNALAKSGQGLAVLNGANTYTNKTLVNEGTLQFARQVALYNNTSASWTAANINVASGATLALNVGGAGEFTSSDVATISSLGGATSGFLGGSKLGLDTSSGDFTHSSAIADTNGGANVIGLRKLGANTLTLAGANTYTGGTSVEQGKLALSQNFSMGASSANAIAIANAAGSVAGTDYAQLVFSGTTLTYGGSLTLALTGTITSAQVYDLISFTSGGGSGNFNSVSITGSYIATLVSAGTTWTGSADGVSFVFDTVTGDLSASVSAVPEPSSFAALAGSMALVIVAGARRRPRA